MPPVRRLLAALATACFIGAVALTPSEVRSRLRIGRTSPLLPAPSAAALPAPIAPDGDPFVARVADDPAGPLRTNVRAGNPPASPVVPGPVVRAIATGPHPAALLDLGGSTLVVTAGDRIGGATVRAVDPAGITLDDGRRLALPAAGTEAPE